MQVRLAESALERLQAELRDIESVKRNVREERDRAGRSLIATGSATGVELAFLESFRKAADVELARLEKQRTDCRQRLDAYVPLVLESRRNERVLEQLREKQLSQWNAAANRELDSQAAESHLARWHFSH